MRIERTHSSQTIVLGAYISRVKYYCEASRIVFGFTRPKRPSRVVNKEVSSILYSIKAKFTGYKTVWYLGLLGAGGV